ncbi:MAG: hypothetical protein EOO77_32035 [Oxalobacteraceae bacterium]|nr:MAG: hypothetical protein EOO77_32035 [Oxalobacteraceae bacterium]
MPLPPVETLSLGLPVVNAAAAAAAGTESISKHSLAGERQIPLLSRMAAAVNLPTVGETAIDIDASGGCG